MNGPQAVTGVVLAGGRSSRMGGGDKCLEQLAGRPMLAHVLARLEPQVSRLVISANGDPSRFASFGLPVVADREPAFQGPLAGIAAGLAWSVAHHAAAGWIVTVPGDTPFVPADLVRRLLAEVAGSTCKIAVACSAEGGHPVVGLWPVSMAHTVEAALARGQRKVSAFTAMQGAAEVFFPPVEIGGERIDPFFNINRRDDLAAAEALLAAAVDARR